MSINARLAQNAIANRLAPLGITYQDAVRLRRIEMILHRWGEMECGTDNGCIERDETTGKAYWLNSHSMRRSPMADRERGALKRLAAIIANYPGIAAFHQTDPRGCALYVGPAADMTDSTYNRGVAVCV